MMTKRRLLFTLAFLISIIVAATFLKLNSYKRYLSYIKQPRCLISDSVVDRKFIPNCIESFQIEGRTIEYKINEMGLRDRPFSSILKNQVVVIGDSTIEGMGLMFEETFGQVMERRLADTVGLQFINMGTRRTGTIAQMLKIRHYFELLKPKYIIWSLTENDFDDDYVLQELKARSFDSEGLPENLDDDFFNQSEISFMSRILLNLPSIQNDFYSIFRHLVFARDAANFRRKWKDKPARCEGINAAEKFAKTKGFKLAFLIVPFGPKYVPWPNEGDLKKKLTAITECIKDSEIIDLRIDTLEKNSDLFQEDLMHFNAKGVDESIVQIEKQLIDFFK